MSSRVKLQAPDISCNHCAMTIKRELGSVPGLGSVQVDVPSKTIDLEYDGDQALKDALALLADIGYPVAGK